MDANTHTIMGIYSYGPDCNDHSGRPTVFGRLDNHMYWIHKTMKENRDEEEANHYGETSAKPYTKPGADYEDETTTSSTMRPYKQ
jgi:secreted trypsin-like serine protease